MTNRSTGKETIFPLAYQFSFSDGDATLSSYDILLILSVLPGATALFLIYPMEKHDKSSSTCYENN
jgi:hypothetical protein